MILANSDWLECCLFVRLYDAHLPFLACSMLYGSDWVLGSEPNTKRDLRFCFCRCEPWVSRDWTSYKLQIRTFCFYIVLSRIRISKRTIELCELYRSYWSYWSKSQACWEWSSNSTANHCTQRFYTSQENDITNCKQTSEVVKVNYTMADSGFDTGEYTLMMVSSTSANKWLIFPRFPLDSEELTFPPVWEGKSSLNVKNEFNEPNTIPPTTSSGRWR